MRYRPMLAVVATISAAVLTGNLVKTELSADADGQNRIAPSEQQHRDTSKMADPLLDMVFSEGNREKNFVAMGFDKDMTSEAVKASKALHASHAARFRELIDTAEKRSDLQEDLCSTTNDKRPRYAAMGWLVERKARELMVVRADKLDNLKEQDWARASTVHSIYDRRERSKSRQENAPIMIVAAVLAGQEEKAREGWPPWGAGDRWSWEQVQKDHPGIRQKIIDYYALFHVIKEIAEEEGGLCE